MPDTESRPKGEGTLAEVMVHHRTQHLEDRTFEEPFDRARKFELADASVRFGNLDCSEWLGIERFVAHGCSKVFEYVLTVSDKTSDSLVRGTVGQVVVDKHIQCAAEVVEVEHLVRQPAQRGLLDFHHTEAVCRRRAYARERCRGQQTAQPEAVFW